MAHSYKNIIITPFTANTNNDPRIVFSGGNTSVNTDVTLKVYPDSNGTLSFEGSAGQLFSITNDLSGSIFSVNDVSGLPIIDVNANSSTSIIGRSFQSNTAPALSITDTWANSSLNFTGFKLNVANTDSGSGSLLMDLQLDGSSRFKVDKNGDATFQNVARVDTITGRSGDFNSVKIGHSGSPTVILGDGSTLGVALRGNGQLRWSSDTGTVTPPWDLILSRDSANTLAQRNGTAPQTFNLYNTYTDGSNYERGVLKWNSNVLQIGTENAGTGTARNLQFIASGMNAFDFGVSESKCLTITGNTYGYKIIAKDSTGGSWSEIGCWSGEADQHKAQLKAARSTGTVQIGARSATQVDFSVTDTARWSITTSFHFIAAVDNTYDIGTSSNRPRNVYVAGTITSPNYLNNNGDTTFATGGQGSTILSAGGNQWIIPSGSTTYAGMLQINGTTSAFPALKRVASGNVIKVTAADNSNNAGFVVGTNKLATTATDGFLYIPSCDGTPTGTPTTQANTVPIVVDTTNNKLYFYSGGAWRDAGP